MTDQPSVVEEPKVGHTHRVTVNKRLMLDDRHIGWVDSEPFDGNCADPNCRTLDGTRSEPREKHLYRIRGNIEVAYAGIYILAASAEDAIAKARKKGEEWAAKTEREREHYFDIVAIGNELVMPGSSDPDVITKFLADEQRGEGRKKKPEVSLVMDGFVWDKSS